LNAGTPARAGFWRRLCAWLLDGVLAWSCCLCALLVHKAVTGHAEPWNEPLTPALLTSAAALFFLLGRCLDAWMGGTPGKFLMGCQVIDARSGGRLHCRQSLWRGMALLLAALPAGLGVFLIGWDRNRQGLHDKLAGSLVTMENEAGIALQELEAGT